MTFDHIINGIRVNINVPAGIFLLSGLSGTGKTRLAKLLQSADIRGFPVTSYSYYDYYKGLSLEAILRSNKYKLILLDRYDMYIGTAIDEIKKYSKDNTVLIDCKQIFPINDYQMCGMAYTKKELKVWCNEYTISI